MSPSIPAPRAVSAPPGLADLASLCALILAASLLGIATRPEGFFAVFWPANALLVGLMVRRPALARPSGWAAAAVGFVVADLSTGSTLPVAL